MRELYKTSQSSTSSACSIVAKAVAKIEQDKKEAAEKQLLNSRKANNPNVEASSTSQSVLEASINTHDRNAEATFVVAENTSVCNALELASTSHNSPSQSRTESEHLKQGDLVKNKSGVEVSNLDNSLVSDGGVKNVVSGENNQRLLLPKTEVDCVGFSYQRLQERASPYDFESALEDFDRTAKDVLTFVQERSDHLLSNQPNLQENPPNKSDIASSSDDGDSIDDDDSEESSDSSKDTRNIPKEGLETITEECGGQTTTSFDETDESEQEQDGSIQFCKPIVQDDANHPSAGPVSVPSAWIDVDEDLSSTDTDQSQVDSSTETEDLTGSKDSSTRCNADFQWIRKDPAPNSSSSKSNHTIMDSDEEADDQTSPTSSSNNHKPINPDPSSSKPPINRASNNQPHIRHRRPLPPQTGQSHSLGSSPEKAMSPNSNCSSGGSLDRRRYHNHSHDRNNRDQKSRSQHMLKSPPPRLEDFTNMNNQREYSPSLMSHHHFHPPLPQTHQQFCQNWCCSQNQSVPSNPFMVDQASMYQPPPYNQHPQRRSVDRFGGAGPIHLDTRGSHPDLYRPHHDNNHQNNCCQYHNVMVPPMLAPPIGGCCGYHWLQPIMKPGDLDDKCRKLQSERDNLQLQVQVLSEQIEAQSDKIGDLEKRLGEKKQVLSNTEDLLQRETLSRSSLETQKLELISQISELKLHQASVERENLELRCHYNNNSDHHHHGNRKQVPAYLHRMSPQPTLTSTPVHSQNQGNMRVSPSPSPVNISNVTTSGRQDGSPKTPPATYKRQIELHYSSLPRQQYLSNGGTFTLANSASLQQHPVAAPAAPATAGRQGALQGQRGGFGRLGGILLSQYSGVHAGLRHKGHSVPNLAETEKIVIDDNSTTFPVTDINDLQQQQQQQSLNNNNNNKNKGIKKIFGKMKRSGSGNLEDLPAGLGVGEFQRGGVRATASPRLGWTEPTSIIKKPAPTKPFADWDSSLVCDWLSELGFDQYVPEARRWLKSGQQLQEASAADYEKELQMKSSLHRKKLQLALIDAEANGSSDTLLAQAGKLDTAWVLRWLDDVGLPQYKEAFLQQRIDGRVLHRLTMDDLTTLHVTSALHAASLRRGIQVLRDRNYDASCLQRRAVEDEEDVEEEELDQDGAEDGSSRKINSRTPLEISLWTSHRVMQWLREVDLAEYAPNLRGAGVHGAIMVLEQRFTADLLAALLSIPPSKTLLRRHLNTRFKELLGCELIQGKREAEGVMGYIALTPQSKLKVPKKSHFSLKRSKSKSEADYGDLVCPMNAAGQSGQDLNDSAINSSMGMTRKIKAKEEDVYQLDDQSNSYPQSAANSPLPLRYESS